MSFSFEFSATRKDAVTLLDKQTAPECVKSFVAQALTGFEDVALVHVKAQGHLFNGDYQRSTAAIDVYEILIAKPVA